MDEEMVRRQQIDSWPRTIQANIARFYQRIIAPVVLDMPVHSPIVTGSMPDMDAYLDGCAAQVDNYTANEANKVYVLVLIALFERYLRLWAAAKYEGADFSFRKRSVMDLVAFAAGQLGIDVDEQGVRSALQEALLVGNIVRHGEGWSMDDIRDQAPHLIDRSKTVYIDLIGQETPDSEWVKIAPADLDRYVTAMIRFWGLVDKQPFAVTSIFVGAS